MNDKEFLNWIKNRLINIENDNIDYIIKLQTIIDNTHPEQISQPVEQEPSNSELTPCYKQMLADIFNTQADKQSEMMVHIILSELMDQFNAKQYVAVKEILETQTDMQPLRDFIVNYIVTNYDITDQDVLYIKNYNKSSVGQKFTAVQLSIPVAIEKEKDKLVSMIFGTAFEKIQEVLDK